MKDVRSSILFLAFKRKREWSFILTLLLLSFVFLTNAGAQESLVVPEVSAVSVDAVEVEVEGFEAVFEPSYDGPAPSPNHPPFDQIPAEDMAESPEFEAEIDSPRPVGVCYPDPVTGATVCEEGVAFDLSTDKIVELPGYDGADGGQGVIEEVGEAAPLVSMSKVANRQDHPWRMNVKLVMRFQNPDGSDYFSQCSGSMIDAEVVQTAGHCVFNRSRGQGWAREIWVYPAWDGNGGQFNAPPSIINHYGYGHSTNLRSTAGWVSNGNFDDDLGVVGIDRAAGMLTGWFRRSRGGTCDELKAQTHNNASYPGPESCGLPGLHNGRDMYYWYMRFDDCPGNQLQLNTTGGCYDAVWGGMSGSSAYYFDGSNRYIRAVASTSNRSTRGWYCRLWNWWIDDSNNYFIPLVRGSSFDVQALDMNGQPLTIQAGSKTTLLNHVASNPTNGNPANATYRYKVYLSTNDNITTSDTQLSYQQFSHDYAAMQNVRVNMVQVTIPSNTPPGEYFLGVIYDSATDGNYGNNDTSGWDAQKITVVAPAGFQDVPPGFWAEDYIYGIYNAGITTGCSQVPLLYCPFNDVNRAQMAAFIVRAVEGEPPANYCATGSPFTDVDPDFPMCKYIKRLSELGITTGFSDGTYRPFNNVNRAQMAAFIVRAVEGEPPANYCDSGSPFTDIDPSFPMCKYIKRLYELGITTGYSDGTYRPSLFVNRTQMAAFLARAFLGME